MESPRPQLVILADAPDAFCLLFGISLLERLLRIVQRLGFREAIIVSNSVAEVEAHLGKPSWARADVELSFRPQNAGVARVGDLAPGTERVLVVSAGFYYDARLLKALAGRAATTLLVDSVPLPDCALLWQGCREDASPARPEGRASALPGFAAALIDHDWLSQADHTTALLDQLAFDAADGRIETCDAAREPTYVVSLRKHVRPVFFPSPSLDLLPLAQRFVRHTAQNGVLDLPGLLDSPIEDWIVVRLCRSFVTPNQVTFVTMLIGLAVMALFATGHLWWGVALAYMVEVLDGVDGKLARTKIETTAAGDWEHVVDYCIELSWWTALAYHFQAENLRFAFWLLLLLVGSDVVDRLAKRVVKQKVGRNLDDVANIDRFVRFIGGRRNINIWILAAALALNGAANGFVLICWWGAGTMAVHVIRALQIRFGRSVEVL